MFLRHITGAIFPADKLSRGASFLAFGAIGGQLAIFLGSPILTRLYTPNEFGVLAVYVSILSCLSAITSLQYELAIPLPKSDAVAANILLLAIVCVLGISAITSLILYFFGNQILYLANTHDIIRYFRLPPLGVLLVGMYQVFRLDCKKKRVQ